MTSRLRFVSGAEELTFAAPWEAHAFALALHLYERGVFTWSEWSDYLSNELHLNQNTENISYYSSWLNALVRLLMDKEVVCSTEYLELVHTLQKNT